MNACSVIKLGNILFRKVAQIFGEFWAILENTILKKFKTAEATFTKNWPTF